MNFTSRAPKPSQQRRMIMWQDVTLDSVGQRLSLPTLAVDGQAESIIRQFEIQQNAQLDEGQKKYVPRLRSPRREGGKNPIPVVILDFCRGNMEPFVKTRKQRAR